MFLLIQISSDVRIKLISEIIHGIQVVKMQGWEPIFEKKVQTAREKELKKRKTIALISASNSSLTVRAVDSSLFLFLFLFYFL